MRSNSTAVMARRLVAPGLDYFPTPPMAARALPALVAPPVWREPGTVWWDPAVGGGHLLRGLESMGCSVRGSDLVDHGGGYEVQDFLTSQPVDLSDTIIVTNPPFTLADKFITKALSLRPKGVAIFARAALLEGAARWESIWSRHKTYIFAPFVERISLFPGATVERGSSATAYAWFLWGEGIERRCLTHIPPGVRQEYARPEDWDVQHPHQAVVCGECWAGRLFPGKGDGLARLALRREGWVRHDSGWLCAECAAIGKTNGDRHGGRN